MSTEQEDQKKARLKARIKQINDSIRVTKVVSTRAVKGKLGDVFAGFSAAWDTVQEDGGQNMNLIVSDGETAASGMTIRESRAAYYIVSLQANIVAIESAWASGMMSSSQRDDHIRAMKTRFGELIVKTLQIETVSLTEEHSATEVPREHREAPGGPRGAP